AKAPFDIFIAMGNEVLPPVHGFGALNLFHCQFPFPLDREHYAGNWDKLENYAGYVVNSEFTRYHVERTRDRLGLPRREVHVLPPPVPQVGPGEEPASEGAPLVILHVGRFSPGGHCKRQDIMIEAFRELAARAKRPLELHLAGALNSES